MAISILDYERRRAFTLIADATGVAAGDVVGVDGSGQATKANGPTAAKQPIGIAAHAASSGERVLILPACSIYDDAQTPPWLAGVGARLYLGATGTITLTQPGADNDIVVVLGTAISASKAVIDIQPVPFAVVNGAPDTPKYA